MQASRSSTTRPPANRTKPVELHWRFPVECSVDDAWRVLSDTDRFNRALRLGLKFTEHPRDDGTVERRAEMRRFGVRITWSEKPFEFVAPEWFRHERVYDGGPVSSSDVECRVEPAPLGVTVDYRLRLFPRSALFRPVVLAEARLSTKGDFDRVFDQLVALLEGQPSRYDPAPEPLGSAAEQALAAGLASVGPPSLSAALHKHLRDAPLSEQARLRPLEFAQRLKIDEDLAIRGFLDAVRGGVLELTWELLCPSCLAPKAGQRQLDIRPNSVHCVSCNIRYDGSFPDSVDVVFRPAKSVREVDVAVECLLSPARTPHVLVQEPVPTGQTVEWLLQLQKGGYRLDSDPTFGSASIEVRPGIRTSRITVDLTSQGIRPAVLRVAPGPVRILVRNRTESPVQLQLEKAHRPPYTLTAGRLFELPESSDLLPPDAVAPGLEVAVRSGWVVALHHVSASPHSRGRTSALWDEPTGIVGNGILIRVVEDVQEALSIAESHDGDPDVAVGIAFGPVAWLEQDGERMPSGRSVDRALALMRTVGGGRIGVDAGDGTLLAEAGGDRVSIRPGQDTCSLVRFASAAERRASNLSRQREVTDPVPSRIGAFRILGELGRGGMGRVLDAITPTGASVVVKVLLPEMARDPDHAQRFYNEAHLTSTLSHPNIVRVFDYGTGDGGEVYMVMEKLVGHELQEFVDAGTMSADRVQHVGVQLLDALQAAHEAGIVHRDIKPGNVFVLEDGHLKVIDFGIAHPMEKDDELAERGVVLGSPRYMSPEQIARDPLDGRTDIYSAGLVLFECLTGDIPFTGDGAYALALARLETAPTPLHERCPTPLPDGYEAVVMRALEVDPPRRWETAAQMADALAAIECPTDSRGSSDEAVD
ncbi:MAG: protein kinase [Myxococcota bacterium]